MWKLFLLVVSLTAVSFGGGSILLAGLERELVQTGQITGDQFAVAVALGHSTPGPLAAFTTAIGLAVSGVGGAVAATAALITVSLTAVFLISKVPAHWFQRPGVSGGLAAVGPLATVIVLFLAGRILLDGQLNWLGLAITAGVALAKLKKLPSVAIMLAAVLVGMVAH